MDQVLDVVCWCMGVIVLEYIVVLVYFNGNSKGGYEWLVEFEWEFVDEVQFVYVLDEVLQAVNFDYEVKCFKSFVLE